MDTSDFDTQLQNAFEVLLGRPLRTFDSMANYRLFFWIDSDLLQRDPDPALAHVEALNRADFITRSPRQSCCEFDNGKTEASFERFHVDYSRSLYVFDRDDLEDLAEFPEAVTTACVESRYSYQLEGAHLASLVDDDELDYCQEACWYACRSVATSGTLIDGMRAATFTMTENLLVAGQGEQDTRFDPRWKSAFAAAVTHQRLREHLL